MEDTELATATRDAIAACDGDARAAMTALLVTLAACEAESTLLRRSLIAARAAISRGYIRGRGLATWCDDAAI